MALKLFAGGLDIGMMDTRYLKKDASNDPMTGDLDMGAYKVDSSFVPNANTVLTNKKFTDDTYLKLAGGTMAGAINMGGQLVSNAASPVAITDLATRGFVEGIDELKTACKCVMTAALPAYAYTAAIGGASAYIEATTNGTLATTYSDGVALSAVNKDRVLIYVQTTATHSNVSHNGIYEVTTLGAAGAKFKFTRVSDWAEGMDFQAGWGCDISSGTLYNDFIFVTDVAGKVGTDNPTFVATGRAYIDTNFLNKVTTSAQTIASAVTYSGNQKISNTAPRLTLEDTDSSPASQTAYLYKSGNNSGLVSQIPATSNLGSQATISSDNPVLKTTTTAPAHGNVFSVLYISPVLQWHTSYFHYTKTVGAADIVFGMDITSNTAHFVNSLGAQVHGHGDATHDVSDNYNFGAVIYDITSGTATSSINNSTLASLTPEAGFVAEWAAGTAGTITLKSANGTSTYVYGTQDMADLLIIDGAVTQEDIGWYYNGFLGQTSANIEARSWNGGLSSILLHWNCDQAPGTTSTLVENHAGGGTYDMTHATGTLTISPISTDSVLNCETITVTPSSKGGIVDKTVVGGVYGEIINQGKEVIVECYDDATATNVIIETNTSTGKTITSAVTIEGDLTLGSNGTDGEEATLTVCNGLNPGATTILNYAKLSKVHSFEAGVAVMASGMASVANTTVNADSVITATPLGTYAGRIYIENISVGNGFDIKSTDNADINSVMWFMMDK